MIAYILITLIVALYLIKLYHSKKNKNNEHIKKLISHASKFNEISKQEENPVKALIMSCYSIGYIRSTKDIAQETELKEISSFPLLQQDIIDTHNVITENVYKIIGDGQS